MADLKLVRVLDNLYTYKSLICVFSRRPEPDWTLGQIVPAQGFSRPYVGK